MEFWDDSAKRLDFKTRAEAMTRILKDKHGENGGENASKDGLDNASNLPPSQDAEQDALLHDVDPVTNMPLLKKHKFSLMEHMMRVEVSEADKYEANRYKAMKLGEVGASPNDFEANAFPIIQFWYAHRRTFPKLYRVATRVFATPPSSSASERVFSIVNKRITPDRSLLSSDNLGEIVVARSLISFNF